MVCKNKREGKQSAAQAMLKVTVLVTTCVIRSGLHKGAVLYSNNLLSCPFLSQKWIPKYLLGVVVMSWSLYLILLFCWCSCVHSHDHHKWLAEGLILIRLYLLYGPNFECINVIYIDMLCFVFSWTATSSTYLQSRCFVTVVWKVFLEECQGEKGLLFVKSIFMSPNLH